MGDMMRTRYGFFPPGSLSDVLSPLAEATEENFEAFATATRSRRAFSADKSRCEQLSSFLNMSAEDTAVLVSFLGGLYQRFRAMEKSGDDFNELVDAFVKEVLQSNGEEGEVDSQTSNQLYEPLRTRLKLLLAQDSRIDDSDKITRLKQGFLKNGVGFGSFVDLRPDFREGYKSIKSLVPIIQFRVITDADDPAAREFVFQCDRRSLRRLKEVMAEVEDKIETLSKHAELAGLVLEDELE